MSVTYPPPAAVNRNSHFREAFMEEYTIASSTRDETSAPETSLGRRLRDFGRTQIDGSSQNVKIWSRIINGLTHLAFSFVLLAIMIEFMVRYRGRSRWWVSFTFNPDFIHLGARAGILFFCWPQAIVLSALVATDCVLDIYYVIRVHHKWQGWATSLRLFLALSYLAQFLVYIGFRQVFPDNYAYWGMGAGYSDPVVYLLLWVIGIWDLLHTAVHRHSLGRDIRSHISAPQIFRRRLISRGPSRHTIVRHTRPRTPVSVHQTGVPPTTQTRMSNPDEVAINMDAFSVREKKEMSGAALVAARAVSPSTTEASSSRSVSVRDEESRTSTAVLSRRASTVAILLASRRMSDGDVGSGETLHSCAETPRGRENEAHKEHER